MLPSRLPGIVSKEQGAIKRDRGFEEVILMLKTCTKCGSRIHLIPSISGELFIISLVDSDLRCWKWRVVSKGRSTYVYRQEGTGKNRKGVYFHRMVMNPPADMVVLDKPPRSRDLELLQMLKDLDADGYDFICSQIPGFCLGNAADTGIDDAQQQEQDGSTLRYPH